MNHVRNAAFAALASAVLATACSTAPPKPEPAPPEPAPYRPLSSDSLFAFGKATLDDMSEEGRAQLDALVAGLAERPYDKVHVIGHSDRIGNDKANLDLSTRRANAVRYYLVQRGVPADKITAVGRGSVEPVVECEDQDREALIACLAPNRRVDVKVVSP